MRQLCWMTIWVWMSVSCLAQSDPTFTSFKGDYYKIPARQLSFEFSYGKKIYDYEKVGSVEYKEINIPDQDSEGNFPGTSLDKGLCMVLESTMTIDTDGCYTFELNSDDGSRFWIDSTHIINNDKPHKMRAKMDSIHLERGDYKVKLWYLQAFPHRYGFIFNAAWTESVCKDTLTTGIPKPIVLNANVLFDHDSAELKSSGITIIKEQLTAINFESVNNIQINGHTDNTGNETYNLALSEQRAKAVMELIMKDFPRPGLVYRPNGYGESKPISSNDSEEGRAQNRRVEIVLKFQ